MKKYPYLYANYKKPEIARSVYEEEAKKQQQDGLAAVSFVADMVPVVSNVKGGWEASVGYDPITGHELSSFDRSVSGAGIVFGGFARVPGKVVKYGSEGAEYVLRVNKAEKTVTKHKVKDVPKGESKAVEKVEKPGGKADVEGGYDQEAVSKGTGKDITFKQGYDKHLIEVEDIVRKKNKGIVGGHNMENFENAFIEIGWDLQSCIISKRQRSTIEGIYEIEYGLPALNREGEYYTWRT
ncbi:pre-toxin TG domain-containing protein [Priestia megaterium]|uniref:pre-toxin TG domain-containing protein n=1 Tax=Priestia megaterium TaxID=1404 RepID=UPI00217E4E17|nr:pre-toxin TG domain-containing protein [Priestia megaterium]